MELLEKMKPKKTLTKNEKTLLILLGLVIVLWASFRFILTPQHNKLQDLIEEKYKYEERISHMNLILKEEDNINKEWNNIHKEEDRIINKYFSNLDQSQILYLLNQLLENENLDVLDISFHRPSEEQIEDLVVDTMDITIPYRANYEGVIETIRSLATSPKKMLITGLTMDSYEEEIVGEISLKLYGLKGINEEEQKLFITDMGDNGKSNPFTPFDTYIKIDDENSSVEDEDNGLDDYSDDENLAVDIYKRELLEDFESGNFSFIPSSRTIKGNISKSSNGKSNRNSIRLEYNILALEDENRAYIDLSNRNILIKYPPSTIGLWVYSYGYSPATLGLRLKGQAGELIDIELSKGISWTGWQYIETSPPSDLSLYPLYIDKIYLELAYNREDYGVLLFDKLEANYSKDDNQRDDYFTFYIVEKGDTLDKISMNFYGTTQKKNIIMKHNEINADKDIREGKILVIPK